MRGYLALIAIAVARLASSRARSGAATLIPADPTVEALRSIDPDAAMPAIFEVEAGHGRHVKPRVRIGVGTIGGAVIACLPGPHVEARVGVEALLAGLASGVGKHQLADGIAVGLRERLRRTHLA